MMKTLAKASLALNIVFAILIGHLLLSENPQNLKHVKQQPVVQAVEHKLPQPLLKKDDSSMNRSEVVAQFSQLLSDTSLGYKELKRILVDGGFSQNLTKAILYSLLVEKYDREMASAIAKDYRGAYWQSPASSENLKEVQEKQRSEMNIISSLFPEPVSETQKAQLVARYGSIPYEKAIELDYIEKRFFESKIDLLKQIEKKGGTAVERVNIDRNAEAAKEKEVAAILSPTEFHEWELRMSRSAQKVQQIIKGYQINGDQYEALVNAARIYDSKYGYYTGDRQSFSQGVLESEGLFAEMAEIIGGQQGMDFLRKRSPRFVKIENITAPGDDASARALAATKIISNTLSGVAKRHSNVPVDEIEAQLLGDLHREVGDLAERIRGDPQIWEQIENQIRFLSATM